MRMHSRKLSSFILAATLLISASGFAAKKPLADSPFNKTNLNAGIGLYFPAVFGGPTFSADFPVYKSPLFKLFIGPSLAVGFGGMAALIDISASFKPTFEIKVPKGNLGIFIDVPLGLSILPTYAGGAIYGLNFGIVPSVKYFITPQVGIYTGLGFALHAYEIFGKFPPAPGGVWNAGVSFAL